MTHQTDEELDALAKRLQGAPLYEGHGEASDAPDEAADAITTLRAQLAEARAERDNANKIMDDWTTLHRVIADIRDASGLGSRPMLSELACEIGQRIAAANARADLAEAERAAQIKAHGEKIRFIVQALTHLRDNGSFKARTELLAWGQNILSKPHDRTALDRMLAEARAQALREAMAALSRVRRWRVRTHGPYGMNEDRNGAHVEFSDVDAAILTLISKEGA